MNSGKVITIDSKHGHHKSAYHCSPLKEQNGDSHSLSFTCCPAKHPNPRLNISALEDPRARDKSPLLTERRSTLGSKIYEMLREIEPSLPAIPTSMTDDQTIEYLKVATSIMRRRQSATEQQLKSLINELQSREAMNTARTARTNREEDRERRRVTDGWAAVETEKKDIERIKAEITAEKEQTQKQVAFINRKIEEIEQLETRYHSNLHAVKAREEAAATKERTIDKREKELIRLETEISDRTEALKADIEACRQAREDAERKRNSMKMTEKTLNAFAKSLEGEKEVLQREKQAFIDVKADWQKKYRPEQVAMVMEDVSSQYYRISTLHSSITSEKHTLGQALRLLESGQSQLSTDRLELSSQKRTLAIRLRDIELREKTVASKEISLCSFEQSLKSREIALELRDESRERSESPVPILTAFSFRPQQSKDSRYRLADLSDSLQASLTPRDVITPGSTEQSRDDF